MGIFTMAISIPLDQMTTAEKFEALQMIWEDLCQHDEDLPAPDWHEETLREREAAAARGEDPLITLDDAKRALWEKMGWK